MYEMGKGRYPSHAGFDMRRFRTAKASVKGKNGHVISQRSIGRIASFLVNRMPRLRRRFVQFVQKGMVARSS
jgi:hypothetical protein